MTQEEIKQYLKDNLRLTWDSRDDNYYIVLQIDDEKITELKFGKGY